MSTLSLAAIDRVQCRRDIHQMLDRGIETAVALELPSPLHGRPAAPLTGWLGQRLARGAAEALRSKVEEGAVHIAHRRAAGRAIERRLDHGVTARRQIPRARETHGRAAVEIETRLGE